MSWFKRKKQQTQESSPIISSEPVECQHKWRDFNWYLVTYWEPYWDNYKRKNSDKGTLKIDVIEPYVCYLCKERENHSLHHHQFKNVTEDEAFDLIEKVKEKYKNHISERAEVEDQILDMQKEIDRDFINMWALYHPEKFGSTINPLQNVPILKIGDK